MKLIFEGLYASPQPKSAPRAPQSAPQQAAISERIEQAFAAASEKTGTSFDYLVKTAERESALNPAAKAETSSAAGLFQFIESTWLEVFKSTGREAGLEALATKIEVAPNGRHYVSDPSDRQAILSLRHDPQVAAIMAGALTRKNAAILEAKLGRAPQAGELYIAHFLGAKGATALIRLAETAPDAAAATYFPKQAAANRAIFYEKGTPRTAAAVYQKLIASHHHLALPVTDGQSLLAFAPLEENEGFEATARVASGWQAAAPEDAFSALFRTDHPKIGAGGNLAFLSDYARTPALFTLAAAGDAQALSAPSPAGNSPSLHHPLPRAPGNGPLDLTRFLKKTI